MRKVVVWFDETGGAHVVAGKGDLLDVYVVTGCGDDDAECEHCTPDELKYQPAWVRRAVANAF